MMHEVNQSSCTSSTACGSEHKLVYNS